MESWLTTKEQKVLVDGEKSRSVKVKSGVPQGTVVDPLMFLLYINDIGENIGSSVRLFADDSLIYMEYHLGTIVNDSKTISPPWSTGVRNGR